MALAERCARPYPTSRQSQPLRLQPSETNVRPPCCPPKVRSQVQQYHFSPAVPIARQIQRCEWQPECCGQGLQRDTKKAAEPKHTYSWRTQEARTATEPHLRF